MAELATSPRYRAYLDHLISELDRAMAIAQAAKAKGFDPRAEVEIPIASDLAGRVEALLSYKGVAARIRELEERMSREEASLKIGDAFVSREFGETTREEILDHAHYDFIVDAIDSLSPKVFLLYHALLRKIPVVSSMGAGAKIDPSQVRIADISKTSNCALAKAVRKRLRGLGVQKGIPVVYSTEMANPDAVIEVNDEACKRTTTGTVSYMPAIFGCYLASYVIRNIE